MGRVSTYGTYGSEKGAILYDRLYKPDGTKRGVVFCHGLNGQGYDSVNYPSAVLDEMVRRGHVVASMDLGGPATWGNDASQAKVLDAKNYLQGSMGAKAGGILLWCGSMGTLVGLNFWRNNPTLVAGIAAGLLAVSLADLHDNAVARGITAASIETAYTNLAGYQAALPTHDPSANPAAFVSAPAKLWYSADDPTVIPSVVTSFGAATGIPIASMGNQGGHVMGTAFTSDICDHLESFV